MPTLKKSLKLVLLIGQFQTFPIFGCSDFGSPQCRLNPTEIIIILGSISWIVLHPTPHLYTTKNFSKAGRRAQTNLWAQPHIEDKMTGIVLLQFFIIKKVWKKFTSIPQIKFASASIHSRRKNTEKKENDKK